MVSVTYFYNVQLHSQAFDKSHPTMQCHCTPITKLDCCAFCPTKWHELVQEYCQQCVQYVVYQLTKK